MGLTSRSVGQYARQTDAPVPAKQDALLVALAGNPNVGKSTLFNALTGMRQHTGNWPGKTVGSAYAQVEHGGRSYLFADIPGTYSLLARSEEEELARDALLFGEADVVLVVCDATCLVRNLQLALQIMEVCGSVIVCVNLLDEAERRGLTVDTGALSACLGVPVVGMSAAHGKGLDNLYETLAHPPRREAAPMCYGYEIARALSPLQAYFEDYRPPLPASWLAARVVEGDASLLRALGKHLGLDSTDADLTAARREAQDALRRLGLTEDSLADLSAQQLRAKAESVCEKSVHRIHPDPARDRRLDRILTHKILAWPAMGLMLSAILWLTISGANVPSELLSSGLFALGDRLTALLTALSVPPFLRSLLMDGVYKTVAWVVSVMLPPMAIFFPLFTLLEDLGYLPRVAFNLDGFFHRCSACGKQSLTMCMEPINLPPRC